MSKSTETTDKNIEIKDLAPEETLTPEEKEQLAGAGRFKPTFEGLEAREMMDAKFAGTLLPAMSNPGSDTQAGHVQTMEASQPTVNYDLPGATNKAASPSAAAKPVFSDDFNQAIGSFPDGKTWYRDLNNQKDPNNNNVTYSNSKDTLQVVSDSGAKDGKALALTINKVGDDKKGNPLFKSARVTTQVDPVAGHLQYGRIEARIKLSKADGADPVWPAFWMLGSDIAKVGWPKCGEVDILEYNGGAGTTTGTLVTPDAQFRYYNRYNGASLGDGKYHTFAMDWSPGSVTFSVDGNNYATVNKGNGKGEIPESQWNFNKPFYVILNVAAFPGAKAGFTSQTMYVDYVRAYSQPSTKAALGNGLTQTADTSDEQQDIRQKLDQIKQAEAVLQDMDVEHLPYKQWLEGQSKKLDLLQAADQAELKLKQAEIDKLESKHKEKALADENKELAIMKDKMAKMADLKTALQTAIAKVQQDDKYVDPSVDRLILGISQDELKLKNQQVKSLQHRIDDSTPDKQGALKDLLKGEQFEVDQLTQINDCNQKIVDQGGGAAKLRQGAVHHELLMKQQNERQLESRLKPDSGATKDDGAAPATAAAASNAVVAGPLSATAAHAAAGPYSRLQDVSLPTGPHLTTQGTINIKFADGTEKIRYKETNPKMFGPTTADNGLWEMRLPVMASQFLNGAANTDMIFLDAEVNPQRLKQLMQYSLSDANGQKHSLQDYYAVVNVEGSFTGDRGAILYKKDKYTVTYDAKNYGDNRNQTHAVAIDAHKSRAGSQAVEYISRFQVTSLANGHQFDIYLGKGPHNDTNGADFLTKGYQGTDPGYPGLIPKGNQSMLDWIAGQSGQRPAIMIGDWNNELNSAAVKHALKGYANAQMFQNHYNYNGILDNPDHPGSNAEDLLVGKDGAYTSGKNITKVNVNGQTWESLKEHGKVNTQVLSFSSTPVTVDNPTILRDVGPYGESNIQVDPNA